MKVLIQYYALLREQRGLDQESLETVADTPSALYQSLAEQHGFTLKPNSLKVAVNDDFATWDTTLRDGDSVVFIPPVAGG